MNQVLRGLADLPIKGTKEASKKFTGYSAAVEDFLQCFKTKNTITDGRERIENITQYCACEVKEFLEGLPAYCENSWDTFQQDFKEFFNANRDECRFCSQDLD